MERSCLLRTTRRVLQEKFPHKPYTKSFIDQACWVKMAGYWPVFFFVSLLTKTKSRSINSRKKKLGQYPAILTSHLVNNPFMARHSSYTLGRKLTFASHESTAYLHFQRNSVLSKHLYSMQNLKMHFLKDQNCRNQ